MAFSVFVSVGLATATTSAVGSSAAAGELQHRGMTTMLAVALMAMLPLCSA